MSILQMNLLGVPHLRREGAVCAVRLRKALALLAYLAVTGRLLAPHDDDVVLQDPRVDHRIAFHAQKELLAAARERLGDGQVVLDVLLGEQRPARGDLADER